jgi:hypothetical protein
MAPESPELRSGCPANLSCGERCGGDMSRKPEPSVGKETPVTPHEVQGWFSSPYVETPDQGRADLFASTLNHHLQMLQSMPARVQRFKNNQSRLRSIRINEALATLNADLPLILDDFDASLCVSEASGVLHRTLTLELELNRKLLKAVTEAVPIYSTYAVPQRGAPNAYWHHLLNEIWCFGLRDIVGEKQTNIEKVWIPIISQMLARVGFNPTHAAILKALQPIRAREKAQ